MTKTKKNRRGKIQKCNKSAKKYKKVTRRNFKKTNKIRGGDVKAVLTKIKGFFVKPPNHTSLDRTDSNSSFSSEDTLGNNVSDPKKEFLKSLENCIIEIDGLDLTKLDDEKSKLVKDYMKRNISLLYDFINNTEWSKINPGELRLLAGAVLSKTIIIQLFSNCPECPKLVVDSTIRGQIVKDLGNIILKPYNDYTNFERAVKEAYIPDASQSDSD